MVESSMLKSLVGFKFVDLIDFECGLGDHSVVLDLWTWLSCIQLVCKSKILYYWDEIKCLN